MQFSHKFGKKWARPKNGAMWLKNTKFGKRFGNDLETKNEIAFLVSSGFGKRKRKCKRKIAFLSQPRIGQEAQYQKL